MLFDVVLAASATPAPAPASTASGTPWVLVASLVTGVVAIVVALYGGRVQARVARESAERQAKIAADDRREARYREDRARADEREREERNREDQRERDERARADQEARDHQAREDQRQRDERAREEQRVREDRIERAEVHEAISAELSLLNGKYADLTREVKRTGGHQLVGDALPDSGPLLRALNRLVVRLGELDLWNDVIGYYGTALEQAKIADTYLVIATLQERLAAWFLGTRDTIETRRLLRGDAQRAAAGILPTAAPQDDLPTEQPSIG
jgi:hypothetical protein